MDEKQRLKVSGYRGVWGQNLNEEITFLYTLAFAKVIKSEGGKKVLICRDARPTGKLMLGAVEAALEKEELEYKYVGILPTPSILLLVKKLSYDGGVMITASHNPAEYNGIKFVMGDGLFAIGDDIEKIENTKNSLTDKYKANKEITVSDFDNQEFRKIHIDQVLKNINVELIRSKKFKVALDPINSAGAVITKELLDELGCESFIINGEQNGEFTHMPEPRPENLVEIGRTVLEQNADVGFAQDPDADRLVVIDEKGIVLSEEYTLPLAIQSVLEQKKGEVVINLSTSNTSEEVAESLGAKVYRTKIGEPNVVAKIMEIGALIGGEGNGGVIYPTINTARDSLVGIGLILELLARDNKKISEIVENFPKYFINKVKIPLIANLADCYDRMKSQYGDAKTNELDGIRFDWPDHSWIHIRPSNTEPIIRIFGEAKSQDRIDSIFKEVRLTLGAK